MIPPGRGAPRSAPPSQPPPPLIEVRGDPTFVTIRADDRSWILSAEQALASDGYEFFRRVLDAGGSTTITTVHPPYIDAMIRMIRHGPSREIGDIDNPDPAAPLWADPGYCAAAEALGLTSIAYKLWLQTPAGINYRRGQISDKSRAVADKREETRREMERMAAELAAEERALAEEAQTIREPRGPPLMSGGVGGRVLAIAGPPAGRPTGAGRGYHPGSAAVSVPMYSAESFGSGNPSPDDGDNSLA